MCIMMLEQRRHDPISSAMRTTLTLADDVAAAVERLRRERSLGMSDDDGRCDALYCFRPDYASVYCSSIQSSSRFHQS